MTRKLQPARMAELVADSLRRQILAGEFAEGLPKEEALRERFGVAKSSMREALLILRTEGLITARRGNVGGAQVHLPTAEGAAYGLGLGLAASGGTLQDLADTLQIVEPQCAAACASREDRCVELVPHLCRLNDAYETEIDNGLTATRLSREFHESIIAGCDNPILAFLATTLARLWSAHELDWATHASATGTFPGLDERRQSLDWHRRIATAIADGDVAVADYVRSHLIEAQALTLVNRREDRIDVAQMRSRDEV